MKRLQKIFLLMSTLNYITIFFVGFTLYITVQRILDVNMARAFLDTIVYLPGNVLYHFIFSIGAFFILLSMMYIRNRLELDSSTLGLYFIGEIVICLLIIHSLYFSTNVILLLVLADAMTYIPNNRLRIFILLVLFMLYLGATYNFITAFVPMASFESFLMGYDPMMRTILLGIKNVLVSLNIVLFMLYLFFLVQDKIEENKRFIALNNELQKANKQLREYADISEKMGETRERNRLAREIHDTLGHTLTGISVGLEACGVIIDTNVEAAKKQIQLLSDNARQGLNDVRRSVDKLKPDALERYTLKEALDIMMHEFQEMTNVSIHYMCHLPSLDLEQDEQEVVYRIIQESMTNSVRHGHATEIYVTIAKANDILILIVEDNGQGCKKIERGFGLNHMQDRVDLLHGKIRFYRLNGFIVIAELPIRKGETK